MSVIIETLNANGRTIIFYKSETNYEDVATVARVYDDTGEFYDITDFDFSNFRECFSSKKPTAIGTYETVPPRFLKRGNMLSFRSV